MPPKNLALARRARYAKRIAQRQCTSCATDLRVDQRTLCGPCQTRKYKTIYARRANNRAQGNCTDCGRPRDGASKSYCSACFRKRAELATTDQAKALARKRSAQRYITRKLAGRCITCGVDAPDSAFCVKHEQLRNEWRRLHRKTA